MNRETFEKSFADFFERIVQPVKENEAKSESHPVDDIIDIKNFAYEQCKKLYPVDLKHAFYSRIIDAYNEYCEEVEELAEED